MQIPMGPAVPSVRRVERLTNGLASSELIHNRIWLNAPAAPTTLILDPDTISNDVSDNDAAGSIDLGDLECTGAAGAVVESTRVDNVLTGSTREGCLMSARPVDEAISQQTLV